MCALLSLLIDDFRSGELALKKRFISFADLLTGYLYFLVEANTDRRNLTARAGHIGWIDRKGD
jgi:hypothetical protein